MKISAIKPQVKRPNRYSIFVDDKYSFSLSTDGLLEAGITLDRELDDAELKALKKLSTDDKAYSLALSYVARRVRSEGELRDYFRRKDYEPELADVLIAKLTSAGFVNDFDFAERWVENRRQLKHSSTKKLKMELRQKHIASDIIDKVLSGDQLSETESIRMMVEKKRRQTRYQDDTKLMAYLARQGFSYGDIKSALEQED